jgi:hypothetical protein
MKPVSMGVALLCLFAPTGSTFLIWALYHFHLESKRSARRRKHTMGIVRPAASESRNRLGTKSFIIAVMPILVATNVIGQSKGSPPTPRNGQTDALEKKVEGLEQELQEVKARLRALRASEAIATEPTTSPATSQTATYSAAAAEMPNVSASTLREVAAVPVAASPVATEQTVKPAPAPKSESSLLPGQLPGGVTLNYTFDGYYGYDFNHPIGRVQYLRAYDVLSNAFSVNQAGIVMDMLPDVAGGRRYGFRLDLQYGQATETLQGNTANESRPEIYRNIFQAYGTYVVPLGKGLTVDFGKWASSLGVESNYTKDQMNYTRSYWFTYLPFYP